MIAVNMDGEIASEHYAGVRYRQPDIGKLFEPYVSVIASVYRHTRDHDDDGNRIPCPRFGGVTCGEHIAIEPLLHDQYFDETRVAPRHIMVEADKRCTTCTTPSTPRSSSGSPRESPSAFSSPTRSPRIGRSRSASRRRTPRTASTSRPCTGRAGRPGRISGGAESLGSKAPLQILRQALFGLDTELATIARRTWLPATTPRPSTSSWRRSRCPCRPMTAFSWSAHSTASGTSIHEEAGRRPEAWATVLRQSTLPGGVTRLGAPRVLRGGRGVAGRVRRGALQRRVQRGCVQVHGGHAGPRRRPEGHDLPVRAGSRQGSSRGFGSRTRSMRPSGRRRPAPAAGASTPRCPSHGGT